MRGGEHRWFMSQVGSCRSDSVTLHCSRKRKLTIREPFQAFDLWASRYAPSPSTVQATGSQNTVPFTFSRLLQDFLREDFFRFLAPSTSALGFMETCHVCTPNLLTLAQTIDCRMDYCIVHSTRQGARKYTPNTRLCM